MHRQNEGSFEMRLVLFLAILSLLATDLSGQVPEFDRQVEQFLAEQRKELPANSKYEIGDSPVLRTILERAKAIIEERKAKSPELALGAEHEAKALNLAIQSIAGTVIPANFLERERERPQRPLDLGMPEFQKGASPDAISFDWRTLGKLTRIRNQVPPTF